MKLVLRFTVLAASIAAIGILGWLALGWIISGAFRSATKEGDLQKLSSVIEASVGSTLAGGDTSHLRESSAGQNAMSYYQENPQILRRDEKYFETWRSALAVAEASSKGINPLNTWTSTKTGVWTPPAQRADSWGHAF